MRRFFTVTFHKYLDADNRAALAVVLYDIAAPVVPDDRMIDGARVVRFWLDYQRYSSLERMRKRLDDLSLHYISYQETRR